MGRFLVAAFAFACLGRAGDYYAGGVAGLSTLSADGRSIVSEAESHASLYKPGNGSAVNLFLGRYLGNYVAVQGNFIWNANDLTFTSTTAAPEGASFYSQTRSSSQSASTGDLLIYFRDRSSRIRPYLSAGVGLIHLGSSQQKIDFISGSPVVPPTAFSANIAGLRVAVGMDVKLVHGFSFRYSFSETISSDPLSDQLSPPGQRGLKNFQNLWGVLKSF